MACGLAPPVRESVPIFDLVKVSLRCCLDATDAALCCGAFGGLTQEGPWREANDPLAMFLPPLGNLASLTSALCNLVSALFYRCNFWNSTN